LHTWLALFFSFNCSDCVIRGEDLVAHISKLRMLLFLSVKCCDVFGPRVKDEILSVLSLVCLGVYFTLRFARSISRKYFSIIYWLRLGSCILQFTRLSNRFKILIYWLWDRHLSCVVLCSLVGERPEVLGIESVTVLSTSQRRCMREVGRLLWRQTWVLIPLITQDINWLASGHNDFAPYSWSSWEWFLLLSSRRHVIHVVDQAWALSVHRTHCICTADCVFGKQWL